MTFVEEEILSHSPLFSTIITLYTLILLYLPSIFFKLILSPTLISTLILIFTLLRLGAPQNSAQIEQSSHQFHNLIDCNHKNEPQISSKCENEPDPGPRSDPYYARSFIEWDVRAPLEVIYEEHEGEEAEQNDGVLTEFETNVIQRYASLSLYYPESDSDDSSEGDFPAIGSPENLCFYWEEDFDREGLIEIALDYKKICEFDEDNLIEIDLSPAR